MNSNFLRVRGIRAFLPDQKFSLMELPLDKEAVEKLPALGQQVTFATDKSSTWLAERAAKQSLKAANLAPSDIKLVISAPTLLTSYGFEIPAVALRAALGLSEARVMNISQGCAGPLVAMDLAKTYLEAGLQGAVMVVTSCKASTLMNNFTHGAFFWGDGALAYVVDAGETMELPEVHPKIIPLGFEEAMADQDWGAMRIPFGDGLAPLQSITPSDLKLQVDFPDFRALTNYMIAEEARCLGLIENLCGKAGVTENELDAVIVPSIGKSRFKSLFAAKPGLFAKIETDFTYPHLGGVDLMFFLAKYLSRRQGREPGFIAALTPTFTAGWAGYLFKIE